MGWSSRQTGRCVTVVAVGAVACIGFSPSGHATPNNSAEQNFFQEVYQYAHPNVGPDFLLQLGYQVCDVRRSGGDSGDAKVAISQTLWARGLNAVGAEVGSLVHGAIETLCPEVGYP